MAMRDQTPTGDMEGTSYTAWRPESKDDLDSVHISDSTTSVEMSQRNDNIGRTYLCLPHWVCPEFKILFNLAWTMVVATILANLLSPVGLMFAGHLGILELGGVALGNTIVNLVGNAIGIGLSTACDTFFAQTYGSGNKKKVGVYLQRGTYVILLFAFPCWAVLLNTGGILVSLGQELDIARIADEYILYYMPTIPFTFMFHILSKYLRNQNIIMPTLWACGAGVLGCALTAYLLVTVAQWGIMGVAFSQFVGFFIMVCGTLGYAVFSPNCRETWGGFSWDGLQDWGQFTSLAVFGMFLVLEQMGAFEVGTILAGLLGEVQLGAQTILFQVEIITFMVPIGVGIACNIRIGHLLGANEPIQTKRSIYMGYLIIWSFSIISAVLLISLRYQIPRMFTADMDVIETTANLLLIVALYAIFEGTVGTSGGMLRGCGRQRTAAIITFVGLYLVGLPIGIYLMFYTYLGTAGFWWGLTAGIILQSVIYIIVIMFSDWEKEASQAQLRIGVKHHIPGQGDGEAFVHSGGEELETDLELETDPTQPLIPRRQRYESMMASWDRKYCGQFDSSTPDMTKLEHDHKNRRLTKQEMICRRGLVLILCCLMVALGLAVRIMFPIDLTNYSNTTEFTTTSSLP